MVHWILYIIAVVSGLAALILKVRDKPKAKKKWQDWRIGLAISAVSVLLALTRTPDNFDARIKGLEFSFDSLRASIISRDSSSARIQAEFLESENLVRTALDSGMVAIAFGELEAARLHLWYAIHGSTSDSLRSDALMLYGVVLGLEADANADGENPTTDTSLYISAISYFDSSLTYDHGNYGSWHNRAFALEKIGRVDEAMSDYDSAIVYRPHFPEAIANKAILLARAGKYSDALQLFDRAIALNVNYSKAWINRGTTLNRLGQSLDALESYDRAISIDPRNAEVWHFRAIVLRELGRVPEALASMDSALSLEPTPTNWLLRSAYLYQLGRYGEALASLDSALTRNAALVNVWSDRCKVLTRLGRWTEAIESSNSALKLDSLAYGVWCNRGIAHLSVGMIKDSELDFQTALRINHKLAEAWLGMANISHLQRGHERALAYCDSALSYQPNLEEAKQLRDLLIQ